jgi:ParB family chromosome partitioning protein
MPPPVAPVGLATRPAESLPAARVSLSASTNHGPAEFAAIEAPEGALLQLPVLEIQENPFQPRRVFSESEIASLSESLKEHDMLQPILVRVVSGKYQLISGERRLRAAIQAGWKTIPARVREADDRLVAELAIVENLQRKDLNAIEKALSFRRYLTEHQATQEELASRLKIDRSTIANLMRILELPEVIQEHVSHNRISAGHARAILPLGEEREQMDFCSRIIAEGWSVREAERRVAEFINRQDGPTIKPKRKVGNPQVEMLETQAKRSLGTAVQIKANGRGAGRLIIHFKNDAEFQRIFEQVCQERGALAKVA